MDTEFLRSLAWKPTTFDLFVHTAPLREVQAKIKRLIADARQLVVEVREIAPQSTVVPLELGINALEAMTMNRDEINLQVLLLLPLIEKTLPLLLAEVSA